jgi:CheY-like chemotaxis protein
MKTSQQSRAAVSLLIVDDDRATREVTSRLLAMRFPELDLHLARDGVMAEEMFKEHAPQIVITDLDLPLKSGIEMAKSVKAIKGDTKFIAITAYSGRQLREECREIGMESYLVKPLDLDGMLEAVAKCIDQVGATHPADEACFTLPLPST